MYKRIPKETVEKIRTLYGEGVPQKELLKRFSISRNSLYRIIHNLVSHNPSYKRPVRRFDYKRGKQLRKMGYSDTQIGIVCSSLLGHPYSAGTIKQYLSPHHLSKIQNKVEKRKNENKKNNR